MIKLRQLKILPNRAGIGSKTDDLRVPVFLTPKADDWNTEAWPGICGFQRGTRILKIWATVQSYPHKPFWNFSGHTNSSPFGGSSFSKLFCSLSVATSHTWGWPSWGEEDRWGSDNWTLQKVGNRLELKIAKLKSECSVLQVGRITTPVPSCTPFHLFSPLHF